MKFPNPFAAKMTKDGKFRLSVKLTDEVIVTRDASIEEARAFVAQANALLKELDEKES